MELGVAAKEKKKGCVSSPRLEPPSKQPRSEIAATARLQHNKSYDSPVKRRQRRDREGG